MAKGEFLPISEHVTVTDAVFYHFIKPIFVICSVCSNILYHLKNRSNILIITKCTSYITLSTTCPFVFSFHVYYHFHPVYVI